MCAYRHIREEKSVRYITSWFVVAVAALGTSPLRVCTNWRAILFVRPLRGTGDVVYTVNGAKNLDNIRVNYFVFVNK